MRPLFIQSMSGRRRVGVSVTALVIAGLLLESAASPGGADAATVVQAWQTRIGVRSSDAATLQVYETKNGVLRIRATKTKLRASSSYSVTVYKGSCGWLISSLGPVLFTLPPVSTGSSGAISKTYAVSATQASKVRAAWNAGSGVALVFKRGSSGYCGDFAALGQLGQTVRLENAQMHVVTRAERWSGTGRAQPQAGGAYVTVYVRITARTKTSYNHRTYTLRDAAGTDWKPPIILWDERQPELGSGDLAPGESAEGWVTSIAPEDQLDSLTLVYWMHSSGFLMSFDTATLLVPLGPLGEPGTGESPTPSPSSSPTAAPSVMPSL